jgi:hypothetical protein
MYDRDNREQSRSLQNTATMETVPASRVGNSDRVRSWDRFLKADFGEPEVSLAQMIHKKKTTSGVRTPILMQHFGKTRIASVWLQLRLVQDLREVRGKIGIMLLTY